MFQCGGQRGKSRGGEGGGVVDESVRHLRAVKWCSDVMHVNMQYTISNQTNSNTKTCRKSDRKEQEYNYKDKGTKGLTKHL